VREPPGPDKEKSAVVMMITTADGSLGDVIIMIIIG